MPPILMMEVWDEATFIVKHHKQKICADSSPPCAISPQKLRDEGWQVDYVAAGRCRQHGQLHRRSRARLRNATHRPKCA